MKDYKSWISILFLITLLMNVSYSSELPGCELTFSVDFDDRTIHAQVAPEQLKFGTTRAGRVEFGKGIRGAALKTGGNSNNQNGFPRAYWWTTSQTNPGVNAVEMPFTVSFWMKFEKEFLSSQAAAFFGWSRKLPGGYQIMQTANDASEIYYLILAYPECKDDYIHLVRGEDPPQFKLDDWYHFVASWDTVGDGMSRISLYRDGMYLDSKILNRQLTTEDLSLHGELCLGLPETCSSILLQDELRFWKGTPKEDDIFNIYEKSYPFPNQVENINIYRDQTTNWSTKITWVVPGHSQKGEAARFFRVYRSNSPNFAKNEKTLVGELSNSGSPGKMITWTDKFTGNKDNRVQDFYYAVSAISYKGGNDSHSLTEEILASGMTN